MISKTYVINTNGRPDRLRNMTERFIKLGLCESVKEFIEKYRFKAIEGGSIEKSKLNLSANPIKKLNNGEIGCYLSHIQIYREIIKNGYKNTLILEDDADIKPGWDENMTLPEGYDMIYLGRLNYDTWNPSEKIGLIQEVCPGFWESTRNWLTHAYIISLDGAVKLLKELTERPIRSCLDNEIAIIQDECNFSCYAYHPARIKQDKTKSSLR